MNANLNEYWRRVKTLVNEYLVGIDIGTSGCKAALFTPEGEVVYQGTSAYRTYYPEPGHAEQNPEDWWKAVCESVRRMLETTGIDPRQIKGIGVDGQSGAAIPMDGRGRPLRPAMIWLDRRSVKECEWIADKVGRERLFEVSGNPVAPSDVSGKIRWMQVNEPDLYKTTRKFVQCNSYVVYRLTGR